MTRWVLPAKAFSFEYQSREEVYDQVELVERLAAIHKLL